MAGVLAAFEKHRTALLVMATAAGKTVTFAKLAEHFHAHGQRTLVLAHREELLTQAVDKIRAATGLWPQIEKAELRASLNAPIVVASVQTMISRRERWPADHFGLVVVDECHHVMAKSYLDTLERFQSAKVLGVTATPDRSDRKNLGKFFETVAYEAGLTKLIKEGWLARITVKRLPIELDMRGVRKAAGDYRADEVGHAIEPRLRDVARAMAAECWDRKTVAFLPLVKTAREFAEMLNAAGLEARSVAGEDKPEDRKAVLEWFANAGPGTVLANAMLLCLDTETEILTDDGWVTHETITPRHRVANWQDDGSVFFEEPKEIVVRELALSEHMVSIESRTVNLRVTNTHRMIVACGANRSRWKKIAAQELSNRNTLPSCGVSAPKAVSIPTPSKASSRRNIIKNAYNLRKNNHFEAADSYIEAERRESVRCSLRHKQPQELTLDECRFIGFWSADGSKTKLKTGGVEYTLTQSTRYPKIIAWIDRVIKGCGFHSIKRDFSDRKIAHIRWSLCRGTGGGSQQRAGVYSIEPYLKKDGDSVFWALSEEQFDALVEGYWYGDGHHGQAENGFPRSVVFNDTRFSWMEMLCSIGPVRGWRCSMYHLPSKNSRHTDQWRVLMIKGMKHHLSARTPIIHEQFKPETVWCVRTSSKNIITRRKGIVTVMGNTEGYDQPDLDCVVCLRPTQSRALFAQMVGRGTRLAPGKQDCLLLDFLWLTDDHSLAKVTHLVASKPEVVDAMEAKMDKAARGGGEEEWDLLEEEEETGKDVEKERLAKMLARLKENRKKTPGTYDVLDLSTALNEEGFADYKPQYVYVPGAGYRLEDGPTQRQKDSLVKAGFDPETIVSREQASKILDRLAVRRQAGLATPKQVRLLKRFGHPTPDRATFTEASAFIDQHFRRSMAPVKPPPPRPIPPDLIPF